MANDKIWFITGCSRGFGRVWTEAILQRGDKVAATARNVAKLQDLKERYGDAVLLLPLDVTDRARVSDTVAKAHAHFGRLDVVVNNAGFGMSGAIEEVAEADARAVMETNFFGSLWVTQAALPLLRQQGGGHIVSVTSMAGLIGEPALGLYNASKWALEGAMDALSREVAHLGIKVTLIEPGPYVTEFGSADSLRVATEMPAYDEARRKLRSGFTRDDFGDPAATSAALFAVVDAAEPPLRLGLGRLVLRRARSHYAERLAEWNKWEAVSEAANGKPTFK
jgi:NAD(P)-dependent dehydrogenase (short-subunit alcohol dehydrogenase family)